MSQNGFEFLGLGAARVAHIDFMMLAVRPDVVAATILLQEFSHSLHRRRFGGVWTDMHNLRTQAFFKSLQPQAG